MSARDFKGRGGGFGGFDTYHKEKLDGLGFVPCVGLVLRRGLQAPSHLGETIQDAGAIDIQHIKHMEFDFSTDDDDPSYLNADLFSEKMPVLVCQLLVYHPEWRTECCPAVGYPGGRGRADEPDRSGNQLRC